MRKLSEATWFSNAFAVCSGIWGKITELAAENQCSRQTAYRQAAIAREALDRRRDPRYEDLLAEKDSLAQENCELWEAFADSFQFPECRRVEFAARATASPYTLLGLKLPTLDFWRLLNTDPAMLAQQLST